MQGWRQRGSIWQLRPSWPKGLVEFIGGTYLAATPQVSYKRLLENLCEADLAIHAWTYIPGLDHQGQARDAWMAFRQSRRQLEDRSGTLLSPLRLGHSLGCKLHLLAPDGGRGDHGLVALSFNNFQADQSIPLLKEIAPRLGIKTEFSPGPQETLRLIARSYVQERNLVVSFGRDELDQSDDLLQALRQRARDSTEFLRLPGDHLTPASAGLRRNLLGAWADDPKRVSIINRLTQIICQWAS
ncbi:DUF1350 family protein [Synechococcus sp. M16CYN]|uniref:DUF1350 family protein n=1 Tax=Synechococcus sp. M16CYN TaxID=3103139 RepID=UPI0032517702